jgi:hypothetical protein
METAGKLEMTAGKLGMATMYTDIMMFDVPSCAFSIARPTFCEVPK